MKDVIGRTAFRIGAGLLILAAMIHVATAWPRVTELAAVLEDRSWVILAGFGTSAVTALAWVSQTALASFVAAVAAFLRFSALFPRPLTPDRLPASRLPFGPGRVPTARFHPPSWPDSSRESS